MRPLILITAVLTCVLATASFASASDNKVSPWLPVPEKLPTDPAARSVTIAVSVQDCGDGAETVFADKIIYTRAAVKIRVEIRPVFTPGINCPAALRPPTEVNVALTQPIGKRAIVDLAPRKPRTRASAKQLAAVRAGAEPLETLLFLKGKTEFCRDSSPYVYLTKPTSDQARRWNERDAGRCRPTAKRL